VSVARGPQYDAFLSARLIGSAFEIVPAVATEYRLIDQDRVTWDWSVTPKQMGNRELLLVVDVRWVPTGTGQPVVYQVGRQRLAVAVDAPLFEPGNPIQVLPVVTAMLGAIGGALVTFLIPRWLQRADGRTPDQPVARVETALPPAPAARKQERRRR
jgi:hypothetical protein